MTTGHFVADVEPGIGVGILLRSVCSISQIPWPFKLSQMLGPGGLVNIRDAFAVCLASSNYMLRLDFGGHFSLICHLTMPHLRENWAEEHFVNFCVETKWYSSTCTLGPTVLASCVSLLFSLWM